MDATDETFKEAGAFRQLGDRPLVVLTATDPYSDEILKALQMTKKDGEDLNSVSKTLHDEESSWSTRGRHELVPGSAHHIQLDRPDVVIAAVLDVVASVRAPAAPFATTTTTK